MQLQILHNQVLLEQWQENVSPSQDSPHLDRTSCEPPPVKPTHPPANPVPSQLQPPPLVMNSAPIPLPIPASVPLLPTAPAPILKHSTMATTIHNHPPIPQQNLVPTTLSTVPLGMVPSNLLTQTNVVPTSPQLNLWPISPSVAPVTPMPSVIPTIPITQPGGVPNIPMPPNLGPPAHFPQHIMAPTTQPNPNHVANVPPITPSTHISQINMNPTLQMNSVSVSGTSYARTQALISPNASAVNNTAPKLNTTTNSHPSMAPQDTHSQGVPYKLLSTITSSHLVRNQPASIPSPMSPPPLNDTRPPLPGIIPISTQSFTYTRPKEFIAAQTLSPIRSPSPTESPVPMLHELAAQIFPKSTRVLTSPVNQLSPSPRKFPTRVLECPSSPPYVSSPPPLPPGLVNSVFSFRNQSPPQASSPTSSSSTPSPIQNPVAFLSSVLPSLPTSLPTNAMGLPKRAPPG